MMAVTLPDSFMLAIEKLFGSRAHLLTAWVSEGLMLAAGCDLVQSTQAQMLLSLPLQQAALWSLSYSMHGGRCLLESRTHARKAQATAAKALLGDILSCIFAPATTPRSRSKHLLHKQQTASEGILASPGSQKCCYRSRQLHVFHTCRMDHFLETRHAAFAWLAGDPEQTLAGLGHHIGSILYGA